MARIRLLSDQEFEPALRDIVEAAEGKVALVTSSGSGIGRSAARKLAQHGAHIALADRNLSAVQTVKEELHTPEREAIAIRVDVAEPRSVQEMVNQTLAAFGQLVTTRLRFG